MAAEPGDFSVLAPGSLFTSPNKARSVLALVPDCFGTVSPILGNRGSTCVTLNSPRRGFTLMVLTGYSEEHLITHWHPQDISEFTVQGPCIALKRDYVGFGHSACLGNLTEQDKPQEPHTEKAAGAGYALGFSTEEQAEYFAQIMACHANARHTGIFVQRRKAETSVFLYRTIKRGQNHRLNNERLQNARIGLVEFATEIAALAAQIEIVPCHSVYRVTRASDVRNS